MKTLLRIVPLAFVLVLFLVNSNVFAQEADTLDVANTPPGNINNVIAGDTLDGGVRAHPNRVYRLERGKIYLVTQSMRINGDIKIVAPDGDDRPPVIAPHILQDGTSPENFFNFVGAGANVELKNLYLLSIRPDGAQLGWSDGVIISGDDININVDGVVFDGWSHNGINLSGQWVNMLVQNCHFRNHQHGSSSWFGGGAFEGPNVVHQDTVIFRNNTFFANNATNFNVRGYNRYALFEHNTLAYGMVYPFLIRQVSNLIMRNNIFYSLHSMGGTAEHVQGTWFIESPDTVSDGIFHIRPTADSVSAWTARAREVGLLDYWTGPEAYLDEARGVTNEVLAHANRHFEITNNAYYWPQALRDFYQTWNDTVQTMDSVESIYGAVSYVKRTLTMPKFITEYSEWAFENLASDISTIANNQEVDPGFNELVQGHVDEVIGYVAKIANNTLDRNWLFDPNESLYPPVWPLPENLRYTNSALMTAGTDGLPLGDLNWFSDVVDVEDNNNVLPVKYSLSEAYPNPFNPETNFNFSIAKAGNVKISIYNLLGQKVKTLLDSELNVGSHTAKWNGTDDYGHKVTSGIYFYRLESGSFNSVKKMVLMK